MRAMALGLAALAWTALAAGEDSAPPRVVDATDCAGIAGASVVPGSPAEAEANTRRIADLMARLGRGAVVRLSAGDYYFAGAADPGHGTIETTAPGQIIAGDGPGLTRIIQTDARRDFGFPAHPDRKRVPSATVRLQHKGCALRDLSVVIDHGIPDGAVIESAAIQVAHLAYLPDGQPLIVETTGIGAAFLIDHVTISRVDVGENMGAGIQSTRFFEVGVDIIGSGGHVRVREMDRLDARIGIRLDNGNHCGQGEYTFEDIHMVGRHRVTDGGVFFDWVGGQAPLLRHCSASFINGFHAGALGVDGDRLEPFPEGAVHRTPDRDWDWLTWHGHAVPEAPTAAQRQEWYGLPRHARVTRAGSLPRTGGTEWVEGRDFTQERVAGPAGLEDATRIHWLGGNRPAPGTAYYVTFEQPKEYRVHDLQWGLLEDFSSQEAAQQQRPETFAMLFEDQGVGVLNPDFTFPVGYGVTVSKSFILNGDIRLRGRVQFMQWSDNTAGVCTVRAEGLGPDRQVREMRFSHGKHNSFVLGDYLESICVEDNTIWGSISLQAPEQADAIAITGNQIRAFQGAAIRLEGEGLRAVRVAGNHISQGAGDGIVVKAAASAVVSGNIVRGLTSGAGLLLDACATVLVEGNLSEGNATGIKVIRTGGTAGSVSGNVARGNSLADWTCEGAGEPNSPMVLKGNSWQHE